ncbi:TonB-dependent receptor plug domain-containing protein [Brevundimonas goettingensis]|uniref:TonB-dependent receptor n=1 Tax=Brevundimonas goettingensis TaxID=2774190 RepID=A0A975C7B5_9CAUL|nr:TonB-dependent receptor [Brevundimonas goettingensis]QTC92541.1 TonB-dependent receptor [Brevundimonas goettingensis]
MTGWRTSLAVLAGLAFAGEAEAGQDRTEPAAAARSGSVVVYEPAFFAGVQPNTALDMIERLPGFAFDSGGDVRGLSGAQGNVLIDGQRPASKSEDLDAVIRRIPAASVLRIEVIRGGAPGIDMQGAPVVANIIRRQNHALEGAMEAGVERHDDGRWAGELGFSASRSLSDDRRLEVAGEVYRYVDEDAGDGTRARRDASGDLLRLSDADQTGGGDGGKLTAAWRQPLGGGTLSANALASTERYDWRLDERISVPAAARSRIDETEEDSDIELGGTWERPLSRGRLEIIGLQRLGWETVNSESATERFDSDQTSGESIGRISLSRRLGERLTLDGGLEGAFNWQEGSARSEEDGVVIDLPSSNVRVEERRAELFGTAAWRPSDRLSVEAGLRLETSSLTQDGDAAADRTLTYAKPRLIAVWTPAPSSQWRFRVEREAGQLSFSDFITSASLDTDQISAGNADLRPAIKWVFEGVYERRFWTDGVASLTVFHEAIEDAIDRVPIVSGSEVFDAPGNIGDAERRVAQLRVSAPLARLGLQGGLLKTFVEWAHTEATDPTTGERRRMSGYNPFEAEVAFTHDLTARGLRWGVTAYFGSPYRQYRFDEVAEEMTDPWWSTFIEWKAHPNTTVTLEAENLTGRRYRLDRTLYDGPRDLNPVSRIEQRRESFGPWIGLKLRRTLG